MYVCISSVTFVHSAKATGGNEMPFGRDIREVRSNVVVDGSGPPREGEIWGSEPPVCIDAAHCQTTLAHVVISASHCEQAHRQQMRYATERNSHTCKTPT